LEEIRGFMDEWAYDDPEDRRELIVMIKAMDDVWLRAVREKVAARRGDSRDSDRRERGASRGPTVPAGYLRDLGGGEGG